MTFDVILVGIATQAFSQPVFVVLVIGLTLVLICRTRTGSAVALGLTVLGMAVSVDVLKDAFQVARPAEARISLGGYGWPSGHAAAIAWLGLAFWTLCTDLCTVVASQIQRYLLGAMVVGVALAVGLSRVYLGVHTLDQVVAGYGVGVIWGLVFVWWYRKENYSANHR